MAFEKAGNAGLFAQYLIKIASKKGSEFQRVIVQLQKVKQEKIIEQTLAIKNEDGSFLSETFYSKEGLKEYIQYIDANRVSNQRCRIRKRPCYHD